MAKAESKFPTGPNTAFVTGAAGARGDAYLSISGANLLLSPEKGNKLWINDNSYTIPSAGVTLAPTGLTNGVAYYIYAYMNGATMTLEASVTAPTVSTTTGVKQKTGDATRTLVGLWLATGATTWSTVACQGASWFNPRIKSAPGAVGAGAITSASLAEINSTGRLLFVNFAGRQPRAEVSTRVGVSVASSDLTLDIGLDGVVSQLSPTAIVSRNINTVGNEQVALFGGLHLTGVSEGVHYVTALTMVSSGTVTHTGTYSRVSIEG